MWFTHTTPARKRFTMRKDVARPHRTRQPVRRTVGNFDRRVLALERDHAHHRAEDFFLRDDGAGIDIVEDRRLQESAVRERAARSRAAQH
jgi:hypothetical protein